MIFCPGGFLEMRRKLKMKRFIGVIKGEMGKDRQWQDVIYI